VSKSLRHPILPSTYLIVMLLSLLPACMSMPPKVHNMKDALRLPPETTSVSARGLADEDMRALFRFPNLRFLTFGIGAANVDAKITDEGLAILAERAWPALTGLQVRTNRHITDQGLETLSQMDMPMLEILVLSGNPCITDAGIWHIARMRQVTYLNLSLTPRLSDTGLEYLSEASQLTVLALDDCDRITDEGVAYLMDMPNLRTLYLGGCENVSPTWAEKYPEKVRMKLNPYTGYGADKRNARFEDIKRMGEEPL